MIVAVGSSVVMAVLAVIGPFLNLWRLPSVHVRWNGWGMPNGANGGQHDTRYGIIFVCAAALSVGGVAACLIARRGFGPAMAICAGALLTVGVTGELVLDAMARTSAPGDLHFAVGPAFWMLVAAGVAGLVAAAAAMAMLRDNSARQRPGRPATRPA